MSTEIKKQKPKKAFDALSVFLLILGLLLLLAGAYLLIKPMIVHRQQDAAAQNLLQEVERDPIQPTITFHKDDLVVSGEVEDAEYFQNGHETGSNADQNTGSTLSGQKDFVTVYGMGAIRIPVINLVMPLANNTDVYSLRVAIGHYRGSALPGEVGTSIYFGHRMSSDGRYFNKLDKVNIGSDIYIDYQGKRYTYTVDKNYIIPVAELEEVVYRENTTSERILLVTCHPVNSPIGRSPERLLVEAYLTDISG